MSGRRLRVLVDEPADAATNMGADAALLELAAAPTLRLYGWRPHAVSLGYFQRAADFADLPAGTALTRRSTGGGAIHHADELTFSLALDTATLPADVAASYALLHDAVARALAAIGVRCRRHDGDGAQHARPTDRWCFREPVRDDLVTDRGKLLGSAQRRATVGGRARVLHHASLVLRRPPLTPFVAAVEDDTAPDDVVRETLRSALARELGEVLGLTPEPGAWTDDERALTARLAERRYGDDAFVRRR